MGSIEFPTDENLWGNARSSENLEMKAFEKLENAVFSRYSKFLLIGN